MLKGSRERGLVYSIGIVFNRLIPCWLFRFRVFDVYELESEICSPSFESNFTTVRSVDSLSDVQQLRTATRNTLPEERVLNHVGIGAYDANENLVGGIWIAKQQFDEQELGIRYVLSPNQEWLYCAYVERASRKSGVYGSILRHAIDRGASDAASQYVAVNPWNRASSHVHKKFAKRRVGRVWACRMFGLSVCKTSGSLKSNKSFTSSINSSPVEIVF